MHVRLCDFIFGHATYDGAKFTQPSPLLFEPYLHVEGHVPVGPADGPVVEVLYDVVHVPLAPPPRPQGHRGVQGALPRARLGVQDELVRELVVSGL